MYIVQEKNIEDAPNISHWLQNITLIITTFPLIRHLKICICKPTFVIYKTITFLYFIHLYYNKIRTYD